MPILNKGWGRETNRITWEEKTGIKVSWKRKKKKTHEKEKRIKQREKEVRKQMRRQRGKD